MDKDRVNLNEPLELFEMVTTQTRDELLSRLKREEQGQNHAELIEKASLEHRQRREFVLLVSGLVIIAVSLVMAVCVLIVDPNNAKSWAVPIINLLLGTAIGFVGAKASKSEDAKER